MRYVSLFSGVEAASAAWSRLGWEPLAFAEVDEFPSAVLACRFPSVPNLGDVCKVDWRKFHERHGAVDVLIGGSPCQSFSIAGNRTGLEGASGLMWQFCRAIRELVDASGGGSPRYVLWENVPGALSSGPKGQKGEDFGCLLRELEKCGYGLAWRVLDSQFARVPDGSTAGFAGPVPQRRRRVFLVGSLGSDGAGEILFERSCLRGDHPKGGKAREALARDSESGAGMGDSAGGYEVGSSPTLTADVMTQFGEVAGTLSARADSSPCVDRGQNVVCMQDFGDCGLMKDSDECNYAKYLAEQGAVTYEYVCCSCGHRFMSGEGPVNTEMDEDWYRIRCPKCGSGRYVDASKAKVICAADDNGKTAIEEDLCGSLKVGGGSP